MPNTVLLTSSAANPCTAKVRAAAKSSQTSELGLVILDYSLKPITFNQKALAILSYANGLSGSEQLLESIPEQIAERIRSHKSADGSPLVTSYRSGRREYICRAYFMEPYNLCYVALLLERNCSDAEAIYDVSAQYNLTPREREVLKWLSMGMTSKEVAEQMNISPNTVKAFLRSIMIKMEVTTRSAIIAKIFTHNSGMSKGRARGETA